MEKTTIQTCIGKIVVETIVDTNHFLYFCIKGGGFHLEDIRQSMCGMNTLDHFFYHLHVEEVLNGGKS
jgi:hypothetical protein